MNDVEKERSPAAADIIQCNGEKNEKPSKENKEEKINQIKECPIKKFLHQYKTNINVLKSMIHKFNKIYAHCKSKRVDRFKKSQVVAHKKVPTIIKKRIRKRLKRKTKRNKRKSKQKRKVVKPKEIGEGDVRNKILEQLELLRQNKKKDLPKKDDTSVNARTSSVKDDLQNKVNALVKPKLVNLNTNLNSPKPSTSFANDSEKLILPFIGPTLEGRDKETDEGEDEDLINNTENTFSSPIEEENSKSIFERLDFIIKKPTKTNDITKIKGWRKKQFSEARITITESVKNDETNIMKPTEKITENEKMEDSSKEHSKSSAFESEALDKFLTNSKLNISYEVPKLIAEETISDVLPSEVPMQQNNNKIPPVVVKPVLKIEKKIKAKTLAEKRKMIESDRQKDLYHEMEINESSLLKQLRREEKRHHRLETVTEIREALKNQAIPVTRDCWLMATSAISDQQFVKIDNEDIRITGSAGGPEIKLTSPKKIQKHSQLNPTSKNNVVIIDEINSGEVVHTYNTMLSYNCEFANYAPGPLSKKHQLDKIPNKKWETVVVPMPKIFLEVRPECGKRLDPKILPLVQSEMSEKGFISNLWADFASSAVINNKKEKFVFPLKYANDQNRIILKKERPVVEKEPIPIHIPKYSLSGDSVDQEVGKLMEDIFKYLETPALDNSNISYCPDCPKFEERESSVKVTPILDDVHVVLSASRKRKSNLKTERELKRLNVQVIEVNVQPTHKVKVNKNCTNIECRLGCVCYDSDADWPQHCGKTSCMLQCSCKLMRMDKQKNHHHISLPEGVDLLSALTMDQIRDQAKRNLAKEERKFTHTVIKANDQTIVVGEGCRERRQRSKKVPQKFDDYIQKRDKNYENSGRVPSTEEDTESLVERTKRTTLSLWQKQKDLHMKPIIFKQEIVPKLDNLIGLKNVLPWCMVHNLYKCFCNGHALEDNLTVKPLKKTVIEKEPDENYIEYSSRHRSCTINHSYSTNEQNVSARTRGVPNFYSARNKSQCFKNRNMEIFEKEKRYKKQLRNDISENEIISIGGNTPPLVYPPMEIETDEERVEEPPKVKRPIGRPRKYPKDEDYQPKLPKKETEAMTRHKSLRQKKHIQRYGRNPTPPPDVKSLRPKKHIQRYSRNPTPPPDDNLEQNTTTVVKRRVTPITTPNPTPTTTPTSTPTITPLESKPTEKLPVFKSILKNPILTATKSELIKKPIYISQPISIAENIRLPDLLVPTPDVQNHFRAKVFRTAAVHIFRMMYWERLNANFHNKSIFIWYNPKANESKLIATKSEKEQPSPRYVNVEMFKNTSTDLPEIVKGLINDQLPGKAFDAANTFGIFVYNGKHWEIRGTIIKKPTQAPITSIEEAPKSETLPKKITSSLHLESKEIPLTTAKPLMNANRTVPPSIRVPIPVGSKDSRWFMLILENDFSLLRMKESDVSIKYSQLKQACALAMHNARTVRFLIPRKNESTTNPAFGGYAVPGLLERIFFGPYDLNEDHGLVTFRYLNGKLMETSIVAQLTGMKSSKRSKGIWLYTKGGQLETENINIEVEQNTDIAFIDLTENDDDEPTKKSDNWSAITPSDQENQLLEYDVRKDSVEEEIIIEKEQVTKPGKRSLVEEDIIIEKKVVEEDENEMPKLEKIDIVEKPIPSFDKNKAMPKLKPILEMSKIKKNVPHIKVKPLPKLQEVVAKSNNGSGDHPPALKSLPLAVVNPSNKTLVKVSDPVKISLVSKKRTASVYRLPMEPPPLIPTEQPNQIEDDDGPYRKKRKLTHESTINPIPIESTTISSSTVKDSDDDLEIISTSLATKPQNRTMWLIAEPKNLGYIEIKTLVNGNVMLMSPISKRQSRQIQFDDMASAIAWIDKLLRNSMEFIPNDFQIRMYLVEDPKALAGRQPLAESDLRGYHLICSEGLFDITELNEKKLIDLSIAEVERKNILAKRELLIEQKYIYQLGDFFLPAETMRSMLNETIINMTAPYIRRLQKKNITLKREKQKLLDMHVALKKRLNDISKALNEADDQITQGADTPEDDDDVILIDDDDEEPVSKTVDNKQTNELSTQLTNKPPPEDTSITMNKPSTIKIIKKTFNLSTENTSTVSQDITPSVSASTVEAVPTFTISNVTSLAENYIANTATTSTNVVPETKTLQPNKTLYASVVLAEGRQVLIPITGANQGKKVIVKKSMLSPIKHFVTIKPKNNGDTSTTESSQPTTPSAVQTTPVNSDCEVSKDTSPATGIRRLVKTYMKKKVIPPKRKSSNKKPSLEKSSELNRNETIDIIEID